MNIAITGSSGLVGSAVSTHLRAEGHDVTRLVRSRDAAGAADAAYWRPSEGRLDPDALAGHDAVINLAGENIFGLWTGAKKDRIYRSRVDGTRLLAATLAGLPPDRRPGVMINASGKDYYGDRPADEPLTEDASPGEGFLARVVRDWEAAADAAREAGVRVVHLRFGLVIDPDALLLQALGAASRLGLGATLGDGRQPFPWVTLDEIARVMSFVLERDDMEGPINVVEPDVVTNAEFTDTLARVLGRPRFLAVPRFALELLGDLGDTLLAGARVIPDRLEAAGYRWREQALEPTLRRLMEARPMDA